LKNLKERKRSLEIPKHVREDNIKIVLKEIGCVDVKWINLPQDSDQWQAVVNVVMKHQLP
jgi:hypothetical protein